MIEILLTLIILAVLGCHVWYVREKNKEVGSLINALVARTPEQYRDLQLTEKVKPIEAPKIEPPDLVPEDEITDEKFAEMIGKEITNG